MMDLMPCTRRILLNGFGPMKVDKAHPLARGLVAAYLPSSPYYYANAGGVPKLRSLVYPEDAVLTVTGAADASNFTTCNTGRGFKSLANNHYLTATSLPSRMKPTGQVSLMWFGTPAPGASSKTNNPRHAGCEYGNGSGSPYTAYAIMQTSIAGNILFGWNNGSFQSITASNSRTNYKPTVYILTISSTTATAWVDGVSKGTSASVGTISYAGATDAFDIGTVAGNAGSNGIDGYTSAVYVWNRCLATQEVIKLTQNPFSFLLAENNRRINSVAIGRLLASLGAGV